MFSDSLIDSIAYHFTPDKLLEYRIYFLDRFAMDATDIRLEKCKVTHFLYQQE